eukprot:snap_masked-scaffold_4-processed-gene-21.51-mRNA-1 protein AED:1.00 eAED:1.00 QI:0/-1/0/0/-1/1/1/0/2106
MSGEENNRPLNAAQVTKMFEELSAQQLTSFSEIIKGILNRSQIETKQLEDFEPQNIERFLHEYDRLAPKQQQLVDLTQRLGKRVHYHMKCLKKLGSNVIVVGYLTEKMYEQKLRNFETVADLIKEHISFDMDVREEEAVEVLFSKVKELLERLPRGTDKKPKNIAKAIISLIPEHIWVRPADVENQSALRESDRRKLKEYIIKSIPPEHMLNRAKAFLKMETKVKMMQPKDVVPVKQLKTVYLEKFLCNHCFRFGHHSSRCRRANEPRANRPSEDTLNQEWKNYIERRKKWKKDVKKVKQDAKSVADESVIESQGSHEEMSISTEDMLYENKGLKEDGELMIPFRTLRKQDSKVVDFSQLNTNCEVRTRLKEGGDFIMALLDSGAFRSAVNGRMRHYCTEITKLRKPLKVVATGGKLYLVWEVAKIPEVRVYLSKDSNKVDYIFENVEVMILNYDNWDNLIIGNDVLMKYRLDPISALEKTVRIEGRKVSSTKPEARLEVLDDWFYEVMRKTKHITRKVRIASLGLDVYKEKVVGPSYMESVFLQGRNDVQEVNKVHTPNELGKSDPVVFSEDEEEEDEDFDIENIDVGANLEKSHEEDRKTMESKIKVMFRNMKLEMFKDSPMIRDKFQRLFISHVRAFGDGDSPTKLSSLTPIRCDLLPGKQVGVLNQHALGFEQEKFLVKRIDQMLKAGIIRVNENPTTAMAVLVVPKKGPKRFRLVVDFRPLNRITQKVSNSLPRLDLQLSRARGKTLFSSFDLLSGFDYLPCEENTGKLFTFTTPWGVAYSFCGAPQGWSNTPSLFSMRQIDQVLNKCGLWPQSSMQWIDDTVLFANSHEEMYVILKKYLRRIEEMNLRINIDKCVLLNTEAEFCGRKVNSYGYSFSSTYAEELLNRAKPKFLHELAQFIYTANFLCSVIPGFAKIRKLVTGNYNITGKLKVLERKRIPLIWNDELESSFSLLKDALKKSLQTTLAHYDHNKNIFIFCDASEEFWSLFLAQTDDKVDYEDPLKSKYKIVALTSGVFRNSSFNWHISCKELYPVVAGLKKYPYLLLFNAAETILFTDHKNLVGVLMPGNVKIKAYASRLGRWSIDFMKIGLKVYHMEGAKNVPADCLSRWLNPLNNEGKMLTFSQDDLFNLYEFNKIDKESYWKEVDTYHVSRRHPSLNAPVAASWGEMDQVFIFKMQQRDFPNIKEVMKKDGKIVLTQSLLPPAIFHAHSIYNHGARKNELKFLKDNYIVQDGLNKCLEDTMDRMRKQCLHCQRRILIVKRPLNITEFGARARDIIYTDFLYVNSCGWILTIIDSLTRITSLSFTSVIDANAVLEGLWKFHASFQLGPKFLLVSDQGSHFVNTVVKKFIIQSGGSHKMTAAYVSQTAGTVEVQNRNILRNMRSLVSEFGLGSNEWPKLIHMIQGFMNSTPLTCRGPEKFTPFQLLHGIKTQHAILGEGFMDMTKRDLGRLQEESNKLVANIEQYQREAFSKGYEYRKKSNLRKNRKIHPIRFHPGEYILMSEKGMGSKNKDKSKPKWTGPFQVKEIISEHLYVVEDLYGQRRTRHSCLMIPFAPSAFIPNASTRAVYIMDRGKLGVERICDLKKTKEGEFKFNIQWKGFSEAYNTWEPITIMMEDIPKLVVDFLKDDVNTLKIECLEYLKILYPESPYFAGHISKIQESLDISDLAKKFEAKIIIDSSGNWFQNNWSLFEEQTLRLVIMSFGMGDFQKIREYIPGKNKQQVYTKLQRMLMKQSLEEYHGLRIDILKVRNDNIKNAGGNYIKLKMSMTLQARKKRAIFTRWRYAKMHNANKNTSKHLKVTFNVTTVEGLMKMKKYAVECKERNMKWDAYPQWSGSLEELILRVNNLVVNVQARHATIRDRLKTLNELVKVTDNLPVMDSEMKMEFSRTTNLVKVEDFKLNFICYLWKKPFGSRALKMDVFEYLAKKNISSDVVVIDPPYKVFSDNPTRGPRIVYKTLEDEKLMNLDLQAFGENTLFFIWTLRKKRHVALKMLENNHLTFLGRLLWIKTSKSGKVATTLGTVVGSCVEECLISVKGELPRKMVRRYIGPECLFGLKRGNSEKPVEFYDLIDDLFTSDTKKVELFGRNNNLRRNWTTVGIDLTL